MIHVDSKLAKGKWVSEHRYLMEKKIHRKLLAYEHVHHIDGDKLNNNIKNLCILDIKEHGSLEGKKARGVPRPSLRKPPFFKVCKKCKRNFQILGGQYKQIFCSYACYNNYRRGRPLSVANREAIRDAYKRKKTKG